MLNAAPTHATYNSPGDTHNDSCQSEAPTLRWELHRCFTVRIAHFKDKTGGMSPATDKAGGSGNGGTAFLGSHGDRQSQHSKPKSLFSLHSLTAGRRPSQELFSQLSGLSVTSQRPRCEGLQWNKSGHCRVAKSVWKGLSQCASAAASGFLPAAELFCQMFRNYGDWLSK